MAKTETIVARRKAAKKAARTNRSSSQYVSRLINDSNTEELARLKSQLDTALNAYIYASKQISRILGRG